MEVIIKADLDDIDEKEEVLQMLNIGKTISAINAIKEQVFRPARKHGYADPRLNKLVENDEKVLEVIGLLEDKFHEILNYYEI